MKKPSLTVTTILLCLALVPAFLGLTGCSGGIDKTTRLPLGLFESPVDNSTMKGLVNLSGWALSEDGIESIVVYVDRVYFGEGKMSGPRLDVTNFYKQFNGVVDVAWIAPLDTTKILPGNHEVLVRAISRKKAVRDLGRILVMVEPSR